MRWIFLLGVYCAGLFLSGVHLATLLHPTVAFFALYFTLPAHLFLYGLKTKTRTVLFITFACNAPFLFFSFYLDALAILCLWGFVCAAIISHAQSLRVSVRFISFVAAYVLTFLFGVYLVGGHLF